MNLANNKLGFTQIQKLCYYAYGFHYSLFNQTLFDEDFIKYDHGRTLQCFFEIRKCTNFFRNRHKISRKQHWMVRLINLSIDEQISTIQLTFDLLGDFSAGVLEAFSHMGGEPWSSTSIVKWQTIKKQFIHSYFGRDDIAQTFDLIQKFSKSINNPTIANVIDFKIHLSMLTTTSIYEYFEILIKKSKIKQLPHFIDKWDSQTMEEAFFGYLLFPIEIDEIFQPISHQ